MSNYLLEMIQIVVSSVVAALIFAGLLWSVSFVRNIRLEKELKRNVSADGIEMGFSPEYSADGTHVPAKGKFSLRIKNLCNVQIRVRMVMLSSTSQSGRFELSFDEKVGVKQTPLADRLVGIESFKTYFYKGFADSASGDFIVLPPLTNGTWGLNRLNIKDKRRFFDKLSIIVEYPTLFGHTALVTLKADKAFVERAQQGLEEVIRVIRNPKLGLKLPRSYRIKLQEAGHDPDEF